MSRVRFWVRPGEVKDFIELKDKDVVHKIKNVLHLRSKQEVYIFDGEGAEYIYKIEKVTKGYILIIKKNLFRKKDSLKPKLILAFPLVKEDRCDFILQKATELGVGEFIPFVCQRSARIKPSSNRLQRWKRIIIEAARQSGRLWLPGISDVLDFNKLLEHKCKVKLAASIDGGKYKFCDRRKEGVLVAVGPEGDFTLPEYRKLRENNFKFIKLSQNILRVETAAVFCVGLINFFLNPDDRDVEVNQS